MKYKLIPNISRSVKIVKRDSSSKLPLEGAKFKLYKKISTKEISLDKSVQSDYVELTGFKSKIVNGHKVYWKIDDESQGSGAFGGWITDKDGNLCIHRIWMKESTETKRSRSSKRIYTAKHRVYF